MSGEDREACLERQERVGAAARSGSTVQQETKKEGEGGKSTSKADVSFWWRELGIELGAFVCAGQMLP